jgi:hypothetical protein
MDLLEMPIVWVIGGIYVTLALGFMMVFLNRGRADGSDLDDEEEDEG